MHLHVIICTCMLLFFYYIFSTNHSYSKNSIFFTNEVEVCRHHLLHHGVRLLPQRAPQALSQPRVVWRTPSRGGGLPQDGRGDGEGPGEGGAVQTQAHVYSLEELLLVVGEVWHWRRWRGTEELEERIVWTVWLRECLTVSHLQCWTDPACCSPAAAPAALGGSGPADTAGRRSSAGRTWTSCSGRRPEPGWGCPGTWYNKI